MQITVSNSYPLKTDTWRMAFVILFCKYTYLKFRMKYICVLLNKINHQKFVIDISNTIYKTNLSFIYENIDDLIMSNDFYDFIINIFGKDVIGYKNNYIVIYFNLDNEMIDPMAYVGFNLIKQIIKSNE